MLKTESYFENIEDIYQNSPCGFMSIYADGTIISVNDTLLNWLGFEREELIGDKKFQGGVDRRQKVSGPSDYRWKNLFSDTFKPFTATGGCIPRDKYGIYGKEFN